MAGSRNLKWAVVNIYGVGHRIAHNEIHDATHFILLIRRANDVTVEFNEIYDLPKYHKFDGGASLDIGTTMSYSSV